jgi:hypothetical protein
LIENEPGRVVYCCERGVHFTLAFRLYEWKKAVVVDQLAIASKLEELADRGGVGLTPHAIAIERALAAVAAVNETIDKMGSTGELKAFNRAFKKARKVDPIRYFDYTPCEESGDAGGVGEGGGAITGAAIGTKRTTRLLPLIELSGEIQCLESRRSKKKEPKGRSRRRPKTNPISPPNTLKRPPAWPVRLSLTRIRKRSAKRKIRCRLRRGLIRPARNAGTALRRSCRP